MVTRTYMVAASRRSRADTGCAHTCKMTYHGTCSLQECTRLINRQEEAAPESTVRTWTRADHPIQRNSTIQFAHMQAHIVAGRI